MSDLPLLSPETTEHLFPIVSGQRVSGRTTLFTLMRNEMAFLPAFLAHYRRLGFDQFLIFDDQSDDGTGAYLEAQSDVAVIRSSIRYGDDVSCIDPAGKRRGLRAGPALKCLIPHVYGYGEYVTYVDADEFLFLPPGIDHIGSVIARMRKGGIPIAAASVVEFFPKDLQGLKGPMPDSFAALLAAYPYFEPHQLVQYRWGQRVPDLMGPSKTMMLFDAYGLEKPDPLTWSQRLFAKRLARRDNSVNRAARHRAMILKRTEKTFAVGSHNANITPRRDMLLTLAHFVYTSHFAQKVESAIAWGSHASGASKYKLYQALLEAMAGVPEAFLSANTARYEDPRQLIKAGLMRW